SGNSRICYRFWSRNDNTIREATINRKGKVDIRISQRNHTKQPMCAFQNSSDDIGKRPHTNGMSIVNRNIQRAVTSDDMEKLPRMSVMLIILGSIQWAVMDTLHLVGQAGAGREKTGRRICDMEYVKVELKQLKSLICSMKAVLDNEMKST
ncbi:hypothetical protein Tsp_03929, partial [Trichinella spiralis]|uniref:hypothetical protein n=1 Tax=Trichinella spiralis TaxID=6334 RepID=UPI0001EFC704